MSEPLSTTASASDFGSEDDGSTPSGAAELYLILHKVRGEPAFDVATLIGEDSLGELWIIPTSGHRAHPIGAWRMDTLFQENGPDGQEHVVSTIEKFTSDQRYANWPDHYSVSEDKGYGHKEFRKGAVADLLERIGHGKPKLLRRAVRR